MDIQFDFPKIDTYSLTLTEKLCSDFFQTNSVITGKQIITFSPIEQVNYLIVMNLLDKWKEESVKVRSPFFDYDAPEVQVALKEFMNKLSQHISIRRESFKPLLQKSIVDTLIISLDPVHYLKSLVQNSYETSFNYEGLVERKKYIRFNKDFITNLIDGSRANSRDEFIEKINSNSKVNQHLRQDATIIIDQLASVLPLSINDITIQPVIINHENKVSNPAVPAAVEEKPAAANFTAFEEKGPKAISSSLNDAFERKHVTLNDLLKQAERPTIAEQLAKSKIVSIKSAITLNQKFIFINNLFASNHADFENAMTDIDKCPTFDDAKRLIEEKYVSKYNWDFSKPETQDFLDIVSRKFS